MKSVKTVFFAVCFMVVGAAIWAGLNPAIFIAPLFLGADHTYTFDVNTPSDSESPTLGDDRIREVKQSVQERSNLDHYWPALTVDSNVGLHRWVTFFNGADTDPCLYTADVDSTKELYFKDEAANEILLTYNGALIVTGDDSFMMFEDSGETDPNGEFQIGASGTNLEFRHRNAGDTGWVSLMDIDQAGQKLQMHRPIYMDSKQIRELADGDSSGEALHAGQVDDTTIGLNGSAQLEALSAVKAWVVFNAAGTLLDSYGVSTTARSATGKFDVSFSTNFANTNYAVVVTLEGAAGSVGTTNRRFADVANKLVGQVQIQVRDQSNNLSNTFTTASVIMIGSQ